MSLAASRSRRANAGAKMAQLLDKEEEDEFYKIAYGGFSEDKDDEEFQVEESEDEVDEEEDVEEEGSDLDENDNQDKMDVDDEDEVKKKQSKKTLFKGPNTKAYKEPNQESKITSNGDKIFESKNDTNEEIRVKRVKKENTNVNTTPSLENKIFRVSTEKKRIELKERQEERDAKKRLKLSNNYRHEIKRLTQEELLEEAKVTEQLNLASLDAYNKLELEKKKTKFIKSVAKGPQIRYHSVAMPIYITDGVRESETSEKQARNFITFTDETSFKDTFNSSKSITKLPQKQCVITGLTAKYFDPLTKSPYANVYAFKKLREMYNEKKKIL